MSISSYAKDGYSNALSSLGIPYEKFAEWYGKTVKSLLKNKSSLASKSVQRSAKNLAKNSKQKKMSIKGEEV